MIRTTLRNRLRPPARVPLRRLRPLAGAALVALALLALSLERPVRASSGVPAAPRPHAAPADAASRATAAGPSELVVLSTSDVKGKSSPCGCHTPMGGLARRAAFADSVRAANPNLLVVDAGGWFPEETDYEAAAVFMADAMAELGVAAAGLGESDLRYGRAFLLATLQRAKLPATCANVVDAASGRTLLPPHLVRTVGRAKVGLFGLLSPAADLGPSRDSLRVTDPLAAAERTVAALRAKGATVIVLLSGLGKVESEEVANVIEGIDLVVAGRKVPLFPNGRRTGGATVVFGGEQSHYVGVSRLALDGAGRVASAEATTHRLGPEIAEQPAMLAAVTAFETDFNEELRRREARLALLAVAGEDGDADEPRDHYVGAEVCARCHRAEYEQWRTTKHARAWETLVAGHADSRTDCVPCHVVGYRKPGGFRTAADAPRLADVQCENCHGMGTAHDATRAAAPLTEATCRQCHDATSSPAFSFQLYRAHIVHRPAGELPPLPSKPKTAMH